MTQTNNVQDTLKERGTRYGEFKDHAEISQDFKHYLKTQLKKRSKVLQPDQHEALDMIFHKIARIINGDADYADSWHDIAGYATLVVNRLNGGK